MTLVPLFDLTQQFNNKNGAILVGGRLYVYYIGRTDLATTWADEDAQATNPNPVLLDNNGRAPVFVDDSYAYTLVVCDRNGAELFSQDITPGGAGSVGGRIVYHDSTLSGSGTVSSLLGVVNMPLGVDDTMTAYTGVAEGKDALILGVNGDWFNNTFNSAFSSKVDTSAFEECCDEVHNSLSGKVDLSALDNYYNKTEINSALSNKVDFNYFIDYTSAMEDRLEHSLEFGYDSNSAISSINNSALAGQGGGDNCPWISGSKVIADTQTLTSNMLIQVLSSFDLSGYKNHNIGVKGGIYRFPNEYEIGSALLHTNYFMHLSGMSAYLPLSSFSSYTASIANSLQYNWDYTNSAYSLSLNNFYNKLDVSAFSAYSAGQDSTINNITNQITNISNASGNWNDISAYQQNSANYLTAIDLSNYYQKNETSSKQEISAAIANVPQGDAEVNNVVHNYSANGTWLTAHQDISNLMPKSESANFYPMTGNPSGFLTAHQDLTNYYQKNETSSKDEIKNALSSKLDTTAFTAWSSTLFDEDYELSAGEGINLVDDAINKITRIDCTAAGTTLTGDAQGAVDKVYVNSGNWISTINNDASALFYANKVTNGNSTITGPILSAKASASWNANANYKFQIGADRLTLGFDDNYSHTSSFFDPTAISSYSTSNGGLVFNWDWHLDYRGLGGTFSDNNETTATWSALRNVDLGLTTGGTISSISGHSLDGKTYTGVAPIQVNNSTNEISITGESLSAGPGIDIFSSGGYVVISSNGGNSFPMTGTDGTANFTANANFSSFTLTTGQGAAGCYVNLDAKNVHYEAYPSTDVSASWYNIINKANETSSNCYCIKFQDNLTAIDLANYSAYDKVTVVNARDYGQDCLLHWDGNTKEIPSGLFIDMIKGTFNSKEEWYFATSGWLNQNWWDYD